MNSYDDIFGSITQKVKGGSPKKKQKIPIFTLLFVGFIFAPGSILASGWLTMTLWNWFIPLLGFPPIGYALALGINLFIGYIRGTSHAETASINKEAEEADSKVVYIWTAMITHWFKFSTYLGVGYVLTFFV